MKKLIGIFTFAFVFLSIALAQPPQKFDLNSATYEQLKSLPLTNKQIEAIWQKLQYEGPFKSIYDLRELPEIDQKTMLAIEQIVRVDPPRPDDERTERIDDAYFRIETLGTEEGTNVGLVDEWIDRLLDPLNVNEATIDELMDMQNISPADAVAIYKQVKLQGGIRGQRDLRSVPGLSSWGYRNARNYLGYDPVTAAKRLHGSYTFRAYNTPFFTDEELAVDPNVLIDPRPDVSHKLRFTYARDFKAGFLWHRNLGEETIYSTHGDFRIPEFKWFGNIEKKMLGPIHFDRTILGDYQISLGQGVIMESGDYFNPRYTGIGFDKRLTGVAPDLSRSQEFTLKGLATEATYNNFKGVFFFSSQKKDAILNPDGSLNRLIELIPRDDIDIYPTRQKLENGDSVDVPSFEGKQSMIDAVREVGYGGEIAYRPWVGTSLGLVATEFLYNKPLKPDFGQSYRYAARTLSGNDTIVDIYPVIDPQERDEIADNDINPEILNGYRSTATSGLWGDAKSARRVYGLNFMTVVNNYTLQMEYGELEKNGTFLKFGDDPHGFNASIHAQWNSLAILSVFRDYSIGYDNPYNRGFGNYSRYNGSTYEDEFYLTNPIFAQLERHSPSPQAERGVYLETRYQFSPPLTVVGEIDNWTRVPDQADYYRWVAKITYRPIFPIMLRVRQKLQGRWNYSPTKETGFQTYENRITLDFRLSRYDDLDMLYATGYTRFTPRPRLSGEVDPTGSPPLDGQGASPTEAIGVQLTHNFSPRLKARTAWIAYNGFFWNFEDTDFQVLDGESARWWFSISNRFSDQLSLRFKLTGDNSKPKTWVQARDNNGYPVRAPGREYTAENVTKNSLSFRIQLDYIF